MPMPAPHVLWYSKLLGRHLGQQPALYQFVRCKCRMSVCCSTTTGMVCLGRRSMAKSGSSTRATRSTSPCPSMTCSPGWGRPVSMCWTALPLGCWCTPSGALQSRDPRCRHALLLAASMTTGSTHVMPVVAEQDAWVHLYSLCSFVLHLGTCKEVATHLQLCLTTAAVEFT